MREVNLWEEMEALTGLVGTLALRINEQITTESHLVHSAPGTRVVSDPMVKLSLQTVAIAETLEHVGSARAKYPRSVLLERLEKSLALRKEETKAKGMADILQTILAERAQQAAGRPLAEVIELFPEDDEKET
jgi:hypothetical protein